MAGHTGHGAAVAQAGVDGGDDAQRQVQGVEHRALFDMHLDKTQVVARIAFQGRDVFGAQPGLLHGFAHAHAVGVELLQPLGMEVTGERARAQKGGLVALAFLFGKGDDFQVKGQAFVLCMHLLHAGQWHIDAQSPVVLAAIAHGIEMAAGHQGFGLCAVSFVDTHHIADRVDVHAVATGLPHVLCNALGAGAVGLGQVGDGELAAAVAELGQRLLPVPDLVAALDGGAKFVVQADLGNAVHIAQAFLQLIADWALQAALQGGDDLGLLHACAARSAHGHDKGETKFGVVGGIERLDCFKLGRRALRQARLALLQGRFGRQAFVHHGLSRQFRVGAQQRQLRLLGRVGDYFCQGLLELRQ